MMCRSVLVAGLLVMASSTFGQDMGPARKGSATPWTPAAAFPSSGGTTRSGPPISLVPVPFNPAGQFGSAVALDGTTAVVGAPSGGFRNDDRAHVFVLGAQGWGQQALLLQPQPNPIDASRGTGRRVALDGDVAVVSAHGFGMRAECSFEDVVLFFRRTGSSWTEEGRFRKSPCDETFGSALALSGNTALVATVGWFDPFGRVDVYDRGAGGWSRSGSLDDPVFASQTYFGFSIAIDGDTALVGAPYDRFGGPLTGAVHVYQRTGSTWTHVDKWTASDASTLAQFGSTVAISGNLALVGAPGDSEHGRNSGAAYVFERVGSTWMEKEKIVPSDAAPSRFFASALDLDGNRAVISAANMFLGAFDSVYAFERTGGKFGNETKLTQPGAGFFGAAVSVSGDRALVGAPGGSGSPGAALLFDLSATGGAARGMRGKVR